MNSYQKNNSPILFLGIGIFFWAVAATYAYLIQNTLRDLMFNLGGIHPLINLLTLEIIYLGIFIALFYGLLHFLKVKDPNLLNLNFFMIGLIILGQILQFLGPMINSKFHTTQYFPHSSDYYTYIHENIFCQIIIGGFNLALYLCLGWMIYANRNLILGKNQDPIERIGDY